MSGGPMKYWPTQKRPPAEPERPATTAPNGPGQELCDLCGGTGWASYPDPFFGGAYVDSRCPACCDLSIRAKKGMWEDDHGRKVGPR